MAQWHPPTHITSVTTYMLHFVGVERQLHTWFAGTVYLHRTWYMVRERLVMVHMLAALLAGSCGDSSAEHAAQCSETDDLILA